MITEHRSIRIIQVLQGCVLAALIMVSAPTSAVSLTQYPQLEALADRLAKSSGLDSEKMKGWFRDAKIKPKIIEAMNRPAERLPWHRYQSLFVNSASISGGVQFLKTHARTLARAQGEYGVPAEIIVAVLGIETRYGKVLGSLRVLDSLTTLSMEYPRRSKFFSSELEHFMHLAAEQGLDPLTVKGSYAGAMGVPQFMPSSYRSYAVDFDGDGRTDLIGSVTDAIGSVAHYLARHHWQPGEPIATRVMDPPDGLDAMVTRGLKAETSIAKVHALGVPVSAEDTDKVGVMRFDGKLGADYRLGHHNFFVITRYNRSQNYAMSVFELAEQIAIATGS